MITGELKSKVDRIWHTMWSGGISNPLSVIEQLTYLLSSKRLDELHTLREHKAGRTGRPMEEPVFDSDQGHLRWFRCNETAPEQMFNTVREVVFQFIKTLGQNGGDEARRKFNEDTFRGFDFDSTLLRSGRMDMLLHGVCKDDAKPLDENSWYGIIVCRRGA